MPNRKKEDACFSLADRLGVLHQNKTLLQNQGMRELMFHLLWQNVSGLPPVQADFRSAVPGFGFIWREFDKTEKSRSSMVLHHIWEFWLVQLHKDTLMHVCAANYKTVMKVQINCVCKYCIKYNKLLCSHMSLDKVWGVSWGKVTYSGG